MPHTGVATDRVGRCLEWLHQERLGGCTAGEAHEATLACVAGLRELAPTPETASAQAALERRLVAYPDVLPWQRPTELDRIADELRALRPYLRSTAEWWRAEQGESLAEGEEATANATRPGKRTGISSALLYVLIAGVILFVVSARAARGVPIIEHPSEAAAAVAIAGVLLMLPLALGWVGGLRGPLDEEWTRIRSHRGMSHGQYLTTEAWKQRSAFMRRRFGHRCQVCNAPGRKVALNVHHRTYKRLGVERPEDLTVLCRECHERFHLSGRRLWQ